MVAHRKRPLVEGEPALSVAMQWLSSFFDFIHKNLVILLLVDYIVHTLGHTFGV